MKIKIEEDELIEKILDFDRNNLYYIKGPNEHTQLKIMLNSVYGIQDLNKAINRKYNMTYFLVMGEFIEFKNLTLGNYFYNVTSYNIEVSGKTYIGKEEDFEVLFNKIKRKIMEAILKWRLKKTMFQIITI